MGVLQMESNNQIIIQIKIKIMIKNTMMVQKLKKTGKNKMVNYKMDKPILKVNHIFNVPFPDVLLIFL